MKPISLLLCVLTAALAGCSFNHRAVLDVESRPVSVPAREKLHLQAVVVMSPADVQRLTTTRFSTPGTFHHYEMSAALAKASRDALLSAASQMFDAAAPRDFLPPSGYQVALAPGVEDPEWTTAATIGSMDIKLTLPGKVDVLNDHGEVIASISAIGKANSFGSGAFTMDLGTDLVSKAVANLATKWAEGLYSSPDLARYAAGRKSGAVAAAAPREPVEPAAPRLSSDVDAPAYRLAEDERKFALVIGIENYKSLPPARFAERDAAAVRAHLEALGYPKRHVILLAGENATRSLLAGYLNSWLPKNIKEDSELFVYFSGHGAPDASTKKAYLVPWDGSPEFLTDTGYALDELYAKLAGLKAKRVIVALDSCFSGAGGRSVLAKDARPLVSTIDIGASSSDKLVVLAAASADEISGSQADQGHGLFTYFLLKGLEKTKGLASVKDLYDFAKPKVMDEARLSNREQVPQLLPAGAAARAGTFKP